MKFYRTAAASGIDPAVFLLYCFVFFSLGLQHTHGNLLYKNFEQKEEKRGERKTLGQKNSDPIGAS